MTNLFDGINPVNVAQVNTANGKKVISLKTDNFGTYETVAIDKEKYDEFVQNNKKANKKNIIWKCITAIGTTAIGIGVGLLLIKNKIGAVLGALCGLALGVAGVEIINKTNDKKIVKKNKDFIDKNS